MNMRCQWKHTEFSDELELRKVPIIFFDKLVSKAECFAEEPDEILRLGFKNSWSSYLDLQRTYDDRWYTNKKWNEGNATWKSITLSVP